MLTGTSNGKRKAVVAVRSRRRGNRLCGSLRPLCGPRGLARPAAERPRRSK